MEFNPMNFVDNLRYMGLGMLGIFAVMAVIIIVTVILDRLTSGRHGSRTDTDDE